MRGGNFTPSPGFAPMGAVLMRYNYNFRFGVSIRRLHKLSRIQNSLRVERLLHHAMQLAHFLGNRQRSPALLRDVDAVFAGDGAASREHLSEQLVQRRLGTRFGAGLLEVHHYVGMNVAVAGMTETSELQSVFFLQTGGKSEKVLEAAARHDDVLV